MKKRLLTRFLSIALAFTILFSDISVYASSDVIEEGTSEQTLTEDVVEEKQETEDNTEEPVKEEPAEEEPIVDDSVPEKEAEEESAEETETEQEEETPIDHTNETVQQTIVKDEVESVYYFVPETETSAIAMGMYSLEDGKVSLKEGTAVAWIDRLDLTNAEEIKAFYDLLVEASDNDGTDDFLIDDSNFESAKNLTVKEITKSMEVKISDASNNDTVADKIKTAVGEQAASIFDNYSPYMLAVRDAFDRDHPEVFWLSGETVLGYSCGYQYTTPASGNQTVTVNYTVHLCMVLKGTVNNESFDVRAENYRSETTIKSAISSVDSACEEILDTVSTSNDYEKIKYFNELLTTTNEYNTSVNLDAINHDCRECTSALEGKTGTAGPVCEGYARAFKVLCDKAGIPCVLVDGKARTSTSDEEGSAHMWNYVQLGNNWYGVDVTWNDPVGGSGAVSGFENERWLLVGADTIVSGMTFAASHPVENSVSANGVKFTNGPELYSKSYEILKVPEEPKEPENTTYQVILHTNGGTINTGSITEYDKNNGVTLPTDVTKDGYIFDGWYEGETFEGDKVSEIPVGSEGDKTFYAKWKIINTYTDRILKDNGEPYTGYFQYEGNNYYANKNGILQSGWIKVGNVWRFFDENNSFREILCKSTDGYLYVLENGNISYFSGKTTLLKNGWQTVSGVRYYFDDNGFAVRGWFQNGRYCYYAETEQTATEASPIGNVVRGIKKIDGKIYGFHPTQYYRLTGWQTLNGERYFFQEDCSAVTGWYREGNYWYYADKYGCMAKGVASIESTDGKSYKYYFDNNYRLTTGWFKINNQWKFFDLAENPSDCHELAYTGYDGSVSGWAVFSDGRKSYIHTRNGIFKGWQTIEGQRYYFDSIGIMETGEFKVGNNWYYAEPDNTVENGKAIPQGAVAKGIKVIDGETYCFHPSGYYRLTGWQTIDKKRFFLGSDGKAVTGLFETGGRKYYAETESDEAAGTIKGMVVTGAKKIGDITYVFHPSQYYMLTGWQTVNGQRYYIKEDGNAVVDAWYQEGDYWYHADETGSMAKGLVTIGEKQYFFDNNYRLSTGWKNINGTMYFFDSVAEEPEKCCSLEYTGQVGGWITLSDNHKSYINTRKQVLTGWQTIEGKRYYFDSTGIMKTGLFQIGRNYYYAQELGTASADSPEGTIARGAKLIDGKIYGFHPTQYYRLTGWQTLDGARYFFRDDCSAVTGWYREGNYWYYADENGRMVKGLTAIRMSDGETRQYYFDSNYRLATGWFKINNQWKFFDSKENHLDCHELAYTGYDGSVSGWAVFSDGRKSYIHTRNGILKGWQTIEGQRYYFDSVGIMETGEFKVGNNWYYAEPANIEENGKTIPQGAVTKGIKVIDGETYCYHPSGYYRLTGWQTIDKKRFFLGSDGKAVTGLFETGGRKYYAETESDEAAGTIKGMVVTGAKKIGDITYVFHPSQYYMLTGWQTVNGQRYYIKEDGNAVVNAWYQEGDYWYHADETGSMSKGLVTIGDKQYFFDNNYRLSTGWKNINGTMYFFDYVAEEPEKCCSLEYTGQVGGWITLSDNHKSYINTRKQVLTGWQTISGQRYYFDANGVLQIGWFKVGNSWYYGEESAEESQNQTVPVGAAAKGIKVIDGKTYCFHPRSYYRLTGWQTVSGQRFYLDSEGVAKTGWFKVGNNTYYAEETTHDGIYQGTVAKGAKAIGKLVDGQEVIETYFFHPSQCYMLTGWQTVNGQRYYLNEDGTAKTGWFTVSGKIYYGEPTTTEAGVLKGTLAKGAREIGGETYVFHTGSYYRLTGWQTVNNQRFYLNADGKARNGWFKVSGKTYYAQLNTKEDGSIKGTVAKGLIQIQKTESDSTVTETYYFHPSQYYMLTGWQTINQERYYFNTEGVMATGWFEVGGYHYYANPDGIVVKGLVELPYGDTNEKKTYYFDGNYRLKTGWQTISGKKCFFRPTEKAEDCYATYEGNVSAGWMTMENGEICYADSRGNIKTGWQTVGGQRYYFDANGVLQLGWFKVGNNDYYAEPKVADSKDQVIPVGAVAKGTKEIGGKTYCFHTSSYYMLKGWQTVGGRRFYLDNNGVAKTGWFSIGTELYYGEPATKGKILKGTLASGAKEIEETVGETIMKNTYFFHTSLNYRLIGWQTVNGQRYYLDTNGKAKSGWFQQNGYWYYGEEHTNGTVLKGAVAKGLKKMVVGEKDSAVEHTYYFDDNYRLSSGWKTIGNIRYFFNADQNPAKCYMLYSGAALTGWYTFEDGRKCYLNSQGNALTGWQTISGKKYYFDTYGIMQTGWCTLNGVDYFFDAEGIYIPMTSPTFASITSNAYGKVEVKWNQVEGVDNYILEYSKDCGFPGWETTSVMIRDASTNAYTLEELETDVTYYFRFRYTIWSGEEDNSQLLYSQYSAVESVIVRGDVEAKEDAAVLSECEITSGTRNTGITVSLKASLNDRIKSADDKYYIVETESYGSTLDLPEPVGSIEKAFDIDTEVVIDGGEGSEDIRECVDRALMNKFALAILKEDGNYQIISTPMGITNPEFVSENASPILRPVSKKGLQGAGYAAAADTNSKNTLFNLDLAEVVGSGPADGYVEYEYKGKTYYFSQCSNLVGEFRRMEQGFDQYIQASTGRKTKICVTLNLLLSYKASNAYLIDPAARVPGYRYYTLNVREEESRETLEAVFFYLGELFGQDDCYVTHWVLGNEVNSSRAWNYQGGLSFDDYMQNYAVAFRLLYNGVKAAKTGNNVYISLDNGWMAAPDTYAGKSTLDKFAVFAQYENPDMLWSIAYHGYSYPLTRCDFWNDYSNTTDSLSTRYISMRNIYVLTDYVAELEKIYGKPSGSIRVILSEQGYNAGQGHYVQAQALARGYYMAEFNDRIDAFIIRAIMDDWDEMRGGLYLGLQNVYQEKRTSFYTYEYMDSRLERFASKDPDKIASEPNQPKVVQAQEILCVTNWEDFIPNFSRQKLAGMY